MMHLLYLLFYLLSLNFFFGGGLKAHSWTPRLKIWNGTLEQKAKIETLKLFSLNDGMLPFFETKDIEGEVTLPPQEIPENSSILIQVTYKGVNYNKVIPPKKELQDTQQEIIVYETSSDRKILKIKGLVQITKENNFLFITKLYLINNLSKYTYLNPEGLAVFIPENAQEISAQLFQGKSMPVPINLVNKGSHQIIERGILPGESSLQISYILEFQNSEKLEFYDELTLENENTGIIFIKPADVRIYSSRKFEEINDNEIPENMRAIKIDYGKERKIILHLEGGTSLKQSFQERKIQNGKIFNTTEKSILGVIAVLSLLFSLSFIFVYHNKQIT